MQEIKPKNPLRWLLLPFLIIAGVVAIWQWQKHVALQTAQENAEVLFSPALEALQVENVEPTYDIDKTVRVIHAMDRALESEGDLRSYLQVMVRQDFDGVAPDVLAARGKVMDVLMKVYARQTELENQEATYTVTRTVLSAMSMVQADVSMATPGASLDKEQAKTILNDLRKEQAERRELLDALSGLELELLGVMNDYSTVYYRHLAEWDELCLLRDRAYLAAAEGNWQATLDASSAAAEKAPDDVEAHLLEAWALIELSTSVEGAQQRVLAISKLNDFVKNHPERSAPALLLLGLANARNGDSAEATLLFQQAAAYYPKQSALLTDMMDPYTARSFLRKSKEGIAIVDQYQATMVGAGAFSPDLHLAQAFFEAGDDEKGRKKVLDHFSRRRNQEQWNLILEDLKYCSEKMGSQFEKILVEDSHLFLETEPTLLGSALDVVVSNQSDRPLRNATLLMAIRFTDMHRDDYQVFKVGETVPVVAAKAKTDFGELEVGWDLFGQKKGVDDIVLGRSILITDDAVVWVDTDQYRLAQTRPTNTGKKAEDVVIAERSWFDAMKITPESLGALIEKSGEVDVDLGLGKDDLKLVLPRELAWMDPVFRVGDHMGEGPSKNELTKDGIRLEFADLANFDDPQKPVRVVAYSRYGSLEFLVDVPKRKILDVHWNP